jgi:hypothetical protein
VIVPSGAFLRFQYRGKTTRLYAIYECFAEQPRKALHPGHIARQTGIGVAELSRLLDDTPELFVQVPRRDGITRYLPTSVLRVKTPDEVQIYLDRAARRESLTLYAVVGVVLSLLVLAVVISFPFADVAVE